MQTELRCLLRARWIWAIAWLITACPARSAEQRAASAAPASAPSTPANTLNETSAAQRALVPSAVDFVHPLDDDQVPLFVPGQAFAAMPAPGVGDWLAEHPEPGQTFAQYVRAKPNRPQAPRTIIYLQPLGGLRGAALPEPGVLEAFVETYFSLQTRALPSLPLRALKLKQRENPITGRRQLRAPDLMDQLRPRLPADAYCLIGLTTIDLYPEETWNFVFGMASLRERVAVHSFARYDPAFDDAGAALMLRRAVVLRRSLKVVAHEIGHMFGMQHCTHFRCLMNGTNHLEETDGAPLHLCPVCLRKLGWVTGADLRARYHALAALYSRLGLQDEAGWVRRRIAVVGEAAPQR